MLTCGAITDYANPAPAKSGVGFDDSQITKAHNTPLNSMRVFLCLCVAISMVAVIGRSSDLPVSFVAGSSTWYPLPPLIDDFGGSETNTMQRSPS